jgi:hypothetical protein
VTITRASRRLILAAGLVLYATAPASAAEAVPVPGACADGPLRLTVVNYSRADPLSLAASTREAAAIWAAAGLELTWLPMGDAERLPSGRVVFVAIRPALAPVRRDTVAADVRRRIALGRVLFAEDGRPGNFIEVAFDAVQAAVARALRMATPAAGLPPMGLRLLVGRALGRVIAHEVGHWLLGSGHASDGLMKPGLGGFDLVDALPPRLPRRWGVAGEARSLTTASRCELEPHAP